MRPTIQNYMQRLLRWAEKWRWLILASIGLSLLWVEILEFRVLRVLDQPFHYFEVFQYAVLLISTGTLIELYSRSNKAHKQALRILEHKHTLSMEFAANEDWSVLTTKLAELPHRFAHVGETYLLMSNPISGKFETVSHWEDGQYAATTATWNPAVPCQFCNENKSEKKIDFHLCQDKNDNSPYRAYSLSMADQELNYTVLKFRLLPGAQLSEEAREIFVNIGDEIAMALRASQNRKRVTELQSAQVAMSERRLVSAYVHDQLGQNLGYLHLKLDQLGQSKSFRKSERLSTELKQLQDMANNSFEIVRDILKKMRPETIPHLANTLQEHARTVSRRAAFSLDFRSVGRPVGLLTEAEQTIFYVFHEILSNIEKHARASQVKVLVIWNEGSLDISVSDNGTGFESQAPRDDNHFGLEILHERIAKLGGRLTINSGIDSGTLVSFSVPINQIGEIIQ